MKLQAASNADCIVRYIAGTGEKHVSLPEGARFLEQYAFSNCHDIVSVSLPSTLVEIINNAFDGCTALKKIILPDNPVCIYNNAFENCTVEEIVIPEHFVTMGHKECILTEKKLFPDGPYPRHIQTDWELRYDYDVDDIPEFGYINEFIQQEAQAAWEWDENGVFEYFHGIPLRFEPLEYTMKTDVYRGLKCIANIETLKIITVSEENPFYASFDGALFNKSLTCLVTVPQAKTTLLIPQSCKEIKTTFLKTLYDRFGSQLLSEVHVETGNRYLSAFDGALYDRTKTCLLAVPKEKQTIQFPDSIRKIDKYAFYCCELPELFLPEYIRFIGDSAFPSKMKIHFICKDRVIDYTVGYDSELNQGWSLSDSGNWLVLEAVRAQQSDICEALFPLLTKHDQKSLVLDMCERWPDSKVFPEYLLFLADSIIYDFIQENQLTKLKRLLTLNIIPVQIVSKWILQANDFRNYEAQMLIMHYVSEYSPNTDTVEEINSWLALD